MKLADLYRKGSVYKVPETAPKTYNWKAGTRSPGVTTGKSDGVSAGTALNIAQHDSGTQPNNDPTGEESTVIWTDGAYEYPGYSPLKYTSDTEEGNYAELPGEDSIDKDSLDQENEFETPEDLGRYIEPNIDRKLKKQQNPTYPENKQDQPENVKYSSGRHGIPAVGNRSGNQSAMPTNPRHRKFFNFMKHGQGTP